MNDWETIDSYELDDGSTVVMEQYLLDRGFLVRTLVRRSDGAFLAVTAATYVPNS